MDYLVYIDQKKKLQSNLLRIIEESSTKDCDFHDLTELVNTQKIDKDPKEFKIFLSILSKISNNHHRQPGFIESIGQIILFYKTQIMNHFNETEIFNLFKENKLIILFLFKHGILPIDQTIIDLIIQRSNKGDKYSYFFYPEIKKIYNSDPILYKIEKDINPDDFDNFEEKRSVGENDSYLATLIRNDMIVEFISFINKSFIPLNSTIKRSIFETNPFLMKTQNESTIIEYAAFFGSLNIFKYLTINNVELQPSLWIYSIHSNNAELIDLLINYHLKPLNNIYNQCLAEAIKCHHNDIANYIYDNLYTNNNIHLQNELSIENNFVVNEIRYYNYEMYSNDFKEYDEMYYLLKENGYDVLKSYIKMKSDLNEPIIPLRHSYQCCKKLKYVLIPSDVKELSYSAFFGCTNLKEVIFMENSSLISILANCFGRCTKLKELEIPPSVEFIGMNAFNGTNIRLKISPPLFPERVNYSMYDNIKEIEIMDYHSIIPKFAFRNCKTLTKVTIPPSIKRIGRFAFKGCHSLQEVFIPAQVEIIDRGAFYQCFSLESVTFGQPSSLTKVGKHAFGQCRSLKNLQLPDSVKS